MTSQGTAHGRFQRATRNRHLLNAEIAARELGELGLADALSFCLLLAEFDPERYDRAAARWHGRFVAETPGMGLADSALALSALQAVPGPNGEVAAQTLRELASRYTNMR